MMTSTDQVLTLQSADQPGIVHRITGAIVECGGNITELQQFSSTDTLRFFTRIQVTGARGLTDAAAALAEELDAEVSVDQVGRPMRTLILASKAGHCLNQLLYRQQTGQLPIEVTGVLANHPDLAEMAGFYGVDFRHQPIPTPEDKDVFEALVREAVAERDVELVVLARYMQIVSPQLCEELAGRAINIHHSFLPGFKGANPYRQAHARGVKVIGATAHFVTPDLDEGPIIEQNVQPVTHQHTWQDLRSVGEDVESRTVTEAVRLYAQHRVFLDGNRTVIFP
ncbi:formyltetrahydrofolate deformylase [Parenemella sanctibonifatiensis]|nr:formyltetrahydrofolate deformylase [Parenemella sanctibonifatiensis]